MAWHVSALLATATLVGGALQTQSASAAPVLSFMTPNSAVVGSSSLEVSLFGGGFLDAGTPEIVFSFFGSPALLSIDLATDSLIEARIFGSLLRVPGTAEIFVRSGGLRSNSLNFTIVPAPVAVPEPDALHLVALAMLVAAAVKRSLGGKGEKVGSSAA